MIVSRELGSGIRRVVLTVLPGHLASRHFLMKLICFIHKIDFILLCVEPALEENSIILLECLTSFFELSEFEL